MDRELSDICAAINKIAGFLATRDIPALSREELLKGCGVEKADMLILLGSGLLSTAEIAACAVAEGITEQFMIVGGAGHSTSLLRESVKRHPRYQGIAVEDKTEAEIQAEVVLQLQLQGGAITRDRIILETESTNCGNNATFALRLMNMLGTKPGSIILIQDPTMQRRTLASFQKAWMDADESARFINYAPFVPKVKAQGEKLEFDSLDPFGTVWELDRFLSLIMGEIPRLMDHVNGYGPLGKNFIAHVDIPEDVLAAYEELLPRFGGYIRGIQLT